MNSFDEPRTSTGAAAHRLPRARRALTLIELLVSIALFGALMGAVIAFLSNMLSARERLREVTARDRTATALLEEIERDLASCVVGDAQRGAGVSGSANEMSLMRRGVPIQHAGRGVGSGAWLDDLERTSYLFDESARTIAIDRTLVRDARPEESSAARPARTTSAADDTNTSTTQPATLAAPFARVRFAYHDGRRWRNSFDSLDAQRLPQAVEIAIWYASPAPSDADDAAETAPVEPKRDAPSARDAGASRGFDERAFALESDPVAFAEAPPDRIRVIAVPDPEPGDEEGS